MSMNQSLKEAALAEFIDECSEMLERISRNMTTLEAGQVNKELMASVYRDMHTIKGSSQLFGFAQLGQLAHAMETCLDPVRKGELPLIPELVDGLFVGVDVISELLAGIRTDKREPEVQDKLSGLLLKLISISEMSVNAVSETLKEKGIPVDDLAAAKQWISGNALSDSRSSDLNNAGHIQVGSSEAETKPPMPSVTMSEQFDGFGIFEDTPRDAAVAKAPAVSSPQGIPAPVAESNTNSVGATAVERDQRSDTSGKSSEQKSADESQNETIRVHVALLDNLMNLVGELVLIRNQLLQHARNNDTDTEFGKMGQRLNVLTAELQNEVMKTRMQPVGNVLTKFNRVVRDLGRQLGKKIDLEILGAETELDKTIIEAVKDPLMHIVRNSIDHGIENADERRRTGKSEVAHIVLNAHHESGQVIIEIQDDGRGLDRQKIGAKAVEKGLVTLEQLNRMTDREVHFLIFASGFSTASAVSNISGRGVGMDVVRTNVERIGGVVDILSNLGSGTTIKLKIPLTLAIVPALIVRAIGQRFAIPQAKLVELLRIDAADGGSERIESLQGRPVLRLRGQLLPLVHLSEILSNKEAAKSPGAGGWHIDRKKSDLAFGDDNAIQVVVLTADGFQFGLIVEEIEDSADIVVKSMSQFLKDLTHFSGATIMGDGAVVLTIDVMGISESARSDKSSVENKSAAGLVEMMRKNSENREMAEFLLVDVGAPGSYAIPLTVVSRLEEFETSRFELSGEQRVVRYRDSLLPIHSLPQFLELPFERKAKSKEKVPIVVLRRGDHLFGIEVEEIQDVVNLPARIDESVKDRPGILGTLLANDRVLVVVDVFGMLDNLRSEMAIAAGAVPTNGQEIATKESLVSDRRKSHVLIVEDGAFFRNYMRQILTESGYRVTTAADGGEAFSILESAQPRQFSLVLSDIEMPVMDGWELAKKVRKLPNFASIPMVAISTRFSNGDIERGKDAGFTRYLQKLNAEVLLNELDTILGVTHSNGEVRHAS